MATTYSAKGTSFPSFTIGKQGVTVLQGTIAPVNGQGINGDLFVQAGSTPALWQKAAGVWSKLGGSTSKIFTGTTNVDTNAVAGTVSVDVAGKRLVNFANDATSLNGEQLTVKNAVGGISVATADTSTTNPVDLVVNLQGGGSLKLVSAVESAIRTSDGTPITIQPGSKTTGVGSNVNVIAGATTASNAVGGNIVLTPGASGSGGAPAQVLLPSGYVPTDVNSVVTKATLTTQVVNLVTASTYSVASSDQVILSNPAVSATITLPSTTTAGRVVRVKDITGFATITVNTAGGNIDGSATYAINGQYGSKSFIFSGTQWYTI